MNSKLFLLAPLLLVACDRSSPPGAGAGAGAGGQPAAGQGAAGAAATAAASAAPTAAPARVKGPKVSAVTALKGGKNRSMRLSIERDGDDLWGYLVNDQGDQGQLLKGKMLDERRFKLTEGGRGKSPASLDGELEGSTPVKMTWTEGKAKPLALTAAPLVPFGKGQENGDLGFAGSIGDKLRIRAQLKREGKQLTGYYRYARSKEDLKLAGSVDPTTGKFEMTEVGGKGTPTGRLRGVFLDGTHLAGSWESTDASRSMPLWLASSKPLPKVLDLPGGGKIIPREFEAQTTPFCTRSNLFPEFDGLGNKKAQDSLNKLLGRGQTAKSDTQNCEGASAEFNYIFEESYTVTSSKRKGFVGLANSGYEYTGGAHGMPYGVCSVADLNEGKLFELHTLLAPGFQARLSEIANRKLREENKVTDLTEAGFFDSEVKVSDKPDLCLNDGNVTLDFSVYEVAPYAMGAPSVSLSFAELKPLMKADPVVDALLK